MTHQNTRERAGDWKILRTGIVLPFADDDWADDESDPLPASTTKGTAPLVGAAGWKVTAVQFVALGYVNATRVVSDNDADTFSVDVTFVVPTPDGSSIGPLGAGTEARSGNAAGEEKLVAIRLPSSAGHRYFEIYEFPCDGAERFHLRFHSPTGAPGAADRGEVWYREVLGA